MGDKLCWCVRQDNLLDYGPVCRINQPVVERIDGSLIYADWNHVDNSAFRISVNSMVAITKVYDAEGYEVPTEHAYD